MTECNCQATLDLLARVNKAEQDLKLAQGVIGVTDGQIAKLDMRIARFQAEIEHLRKLKKPDVIELVQDLVDNQQQDEY